MLRIKIVESSNGEKIIDVFSIVENDGKYVKVEEKDLANYIARNSTFEFDGTNCVYEFYLVPLRK